MIAGYHETRAGRVEALLEAGLRPAHRLLAGGVRLFFDLLVLAVIGLAELDTLRRRAAGALVDRPGRGGSSVGKL